MAMGHHRRQRLLMLLILLLFITVTVGLTGRAVAGLGAAETKTLDRNLEPVLVSGTLAADFINAAVEQLFVYTYTGTGWGGQIPMQIDERDNGATYLSLGNGQLDSNDVIVFMAGDLGSRAPVTAPLTTSLNISATVYEIEAGDPLNPAKKGWAYLFRSGTITPTFSGNAVDYLSSTHQISATGYSLGFTTTVFGLDDLALNGGANILDRSKLRATLSVFGNPITVTENDLGPPPPPTLIKDGPVRVLLQQAVMTTPFGATVNLSAIYQAYGSLLQSTFKGSFSLPAFPPTTLSGARTSVDLESSVNGIFYNANTPPGGVIVDGQPTEVVAETPLSRWSQISHSSGRLIQVSDLASLGGTSKNFYRDNDTPEANDTGQTGSRGESGFSITNPNPTFTIDSWFFVLPDAGGGTDNVGATYEAFVFAPLVVTGTKRSVGPPQDGQTFLPLILK